jgi:hypothetical protein
LRAELALQCKLLENGKSIGPTISFWLGEPALSSVRDPTVIQKLPTAEQQEWQRFWQEVESVLTMDPLYQARITAAHRDWAKSADCYARALQRRMKDDGHLWFEYAAALLLSGDRQGYAKACTHMAEMWGKAPYLRAYHIARACTLAPHPVADIARSWKRATPELQARADDFWSLTEQAALNYRSGLYRDAATLLERSLRADHKSGRALLNWLWLSLAMERLGKHDDARRWLGKSCDWLDRFSSGMPERAEVEFGLHLHDWLEAHILRREAEALCGTNPADPREPASTTPPNK